MTGNFVFVKNLLFFVIFLKLFFNEMLDIQSMPKLALFWLSVVVMVNYCTCKKNI